MVVVIGGDIMANLIDKDALIAEIERRISEVEQIDKASYEIGLYDAYKIILSFINTLEVKGIDLRKEIANQYESNYEDYLTYEEFADIAKHFFELGVKAKQS